MNIHVLWCWLIDHLMMELIRVLYEIYRHTCIKLPQANRSNSSNQMVGNNRVHVLIPNINQVVEGLSCHHSFI